MNNKYKYSMDLSSYFAEKAVEDTTPEVADQGIMKRSPSKAAATETTQEAYDPYSFLPKFAEALKVSFGDPEQGKRFIGSMADQQSEDVRLREVESYMSDLTRRNAIEDVLIGLMPNEPQSFPSAGTLGEPEGTETLPGAPAVSTSPLGPQMATPALNLDAPIDIAPVDPTIMDYATESDLSAIESLVDSLMLESRDDKEVAAETPEEREKYRRKGIMSKKLDGKDGDLDFDQDFTNNFVELMGEREGTEDHTASEGQFTYAYGILPATARSLGVDPNNYSSRKDFAKAVYGRMHQNAKEDYGDVFANMNGKDQQSVMSLYINLGRLPSGVVTALSGEEKDFASAADSLKGVIHYTNRNTNTRYSSKGLSKRRAQEYNSLMEGREGFRRVTTVAVEGSQRNPEYVWYDENNEEVKRFASRHPLSPDNSMSPIAVPN